MATLTDHNSTNNAWKLPLKPSAAGTKTYTLETADKYVDQNIVVTETIDAGALANATGGAVTATVGLADTTYLTTTATGNYGPITATADASRTAVTVGVATAGWIPTTASKTSAAASATQDSVTKYVKAGALKAGSGSAGATGTGVTLGAKTTTQPTSGKYITVTGSGSTGVQTAGWIPADATQSSNTATAYYPIAAATYNEAAGNAPVATAGFSASDDLTTTNTGFAITATANAAATSKSGVDIINTAGWADASGSTTVTTPKATQATATKYIKAGTLANAGTTGVTYTDATELPDFGVVLVSGDYLYINRGMFDNVKVSLAKLVPDGTNIKGAEAYLYTGKTAYDNDGTKITGSMAKAALSASVTSADASASITSISPAWSSTNSNYSVTGSGSISGTANVSASVATSGLAVSSTDNATGGKYASLGATSATGSGSITGTASLSNVTLAATKLTVSGSDASATAPTIAKSTATGTTSTAVTGTVTTTKANAGTYYVAVQSGTTSKTVTASVAATAGYTDGSHFASGSVTSKDITVSTPASAVTYIPITAATYTNGTATISGPTYNSNTGKFDVSSSGNATVNQQGHTGAQGTSTGTVSGSKALNKVEVQATKGTDGAVKPTLEAVADTANTGNTVLTSTLTTTKPAANANKYYFTVRSAESSASTTVTPSVKTAGYGDTTNFTSAGNITVTRGASASNTYYLPMNKSTHSVGAGTASNTSVGVTAKGTGKVVGSAVYYGSDTPVKADAPASGAYIEIDGTVANKTVSIPLTCTITEGYTAAATPTYNAQATITAGVTKGYIPVYGGSYSIT